MKLHQLQIETADNKLLYHTRKKDFFSVKINIIFLYHCTKSENVRIIEIDISYFDEIIFKVSGALRTEIVLEPNRIFSFSSGNIARYNSKQIIKTSSPC